ncbi:calcium/calmodulin-dependent 3',5'-cyclic nucleotide phosphodiesterase 1A isoform X1, partial [Tachysurus ichikawai]
LASKEREQRSEREDLSRKADVTLIHSSRDSESKSLSEVNNTDSLHSSQDSLEQSAASHSADPTDASPGASPDATPDASPDADRSLPWNDKSA